MRTLRERLCKEIWVVGADRYRNLDEDLPQGFEARRADYYRQLGRSQNARAFVEGFRAQMTEALKTMNKGISRAVRQGFCGGAGTASRSRPSRLCRPRQI